MCEMKKCAGVSFVTDMSSRFLYHVLQAAPTQMCVLVSGTGEVVSSGVLVSSLLL